MQVALEVQSTDTPPTQLFLTEASRWIDVPHRLGVQFPAVLGATQNTKQTHQIVAMRNIACRRAHMVPRPPF